MYCKITTVVFLLFFTGFVRGQKLTVKVHPYPEIARAEPITAKHIEISLKGSGEFVALNELELDGVPF